ncbi:MAG: class I SAM-dependent methyltransferase, partial [Chloroflexota bacterium]
MTQSYAMLAALYDELGMADFARTNVPLMLEYAQRNDWLGRQITELGCGTGEGILTLSDSGYTVTGIDMSQEMLEVAQTKSSTVEWIQEDIREMTDSIGPQDLIVAVDVMNEMDNVRELQAIFGGVLERLRDGRLFMFDMYTIAGLTGRGTSDDRIVYDQNGVTMFSSNRYDY